MKNVSRADEAAASQNAQFQMLRTLVEREVRRSGVIMVTSAEAGDGKSLTAHGLAHCLAQSGRRTALVDTTRRGSRQLPEMPFANDGGDKPVMLSLPEPPGGLVREAAAQFVESARERFDYTIIDSAPLLTDNVALALATQVDGVLVSVRVGRTPSDRDESMMRIIENSSVRFLGVVAAAPQTITEFQDWQPPVSTPERIEQTTTLAPLKPLATVIFALVILVMGTSMAIAKQLPIRASARAPVSALTSHL